MDGQCDKLVTVVGHQFITLTVNIYLQHDGHEAPRRAGLSAAAETCVYLQFDFNAGLNNVTRRVTEILK